MTTHNQALGAHGERLAARHLVAGGMVLLERNYRCDLGEIDLVLLEAGPGGGPENGTAVFCEVKTRSSLDYGHPLEAVTPAKAARLRRLADRWLAEHTLRPAGVRIDLVGVVLGRGRGSGTVEHVRGVS